MFFAEVIVHDILAIDLHDPKQQNYQSLLPFLSHTFLL